MQPIDVEKHVAPLEERLDVSFKNKILLLQALTHRSCLNERPHHPCGHNERLEFLGDAVLEMVITDQLYRRFADLEEGKLTNMRAALVNADRCAALAQELGINGLLFLSRGEKQDEGKARMFILANAFEAVLGALYLDQGMGECRLVIDQLINRHMTSLVADFQDPKSQLQEMAQERFGVTPRYVVLASSGPDHNKSFRMGLLLGEEQVATGQGSSKQEAQVHAAQQALATINEWEGRLLERVGVRSNKRRSPSEKKENKQ